MMLNLFSRNIKSFGKFDVLINNTGLTNDGIQQVKKSILQRRF